MDVDRYLARIGYSGPTDPTERTLIALHRAHLQSVPFEALDPARKIVPSLALDRLFDKIVVRERGGFCFELNGLFAALLGALGFALDLIAARPWLTETERAQPFAHLALVVTVNGRRLLADVGFGAWALAPLDLDDDQVQFVDGIPFEVRHDGGNGFARRADIVSGYDFAIEPRELEDFSARCAAYATEDDSPFVRAGPCWRWTPGGWVGVRRDRLVRIEDGKWTEEPLEGGESAYLEAVARIIGIELEHTGDARVQSRRGESNP